MGSAFDDSLEVLFSGLKATCDAATEKGGVALVQAASVDIPSQISAFIARESVAQTPSRLRALSAGLGNSVLIDIATLRSTYFNGGDEGGDATTHARVLTLQALLSLQLGSMCLLPGISRLRVATREKDPLPKALLKRVGRYLGDLQLKQALATSSPARPQPKQSAANEKEAADPEVKQGPVEGELLFDTLVTDTLVSLFGHRYPLSMMYLYTLLDCEVPSTMEKKGEAKEKAGGRREEGKKVEGKNVEEKKVEEEDTLVLRRPKKGARRPTEGEGEKREERKEEGKAQGEGKAKEEEAGRRKSAGRQASFKPKYSPEAYPHLSSAASKAPSPPTQETAQDKDKDKEKGGGLGGGALKRGRGSAHYLNRSLSGLRKVSSSASVGLSGTMGGVGKGTGQKGGPVKAFQPMGGEKARLREGGRGGERERSGLEKRVMSPSRRFSPRLNRRLEGGRMEGDGVGAGEEEAGGRLLDDFCGDVLGTPQGVKRRRKEGGGRVILGSPNVEVGKASRGGGLFGMGVVGGTPEPKRGAARTRRSVAGTPN